MMVLSPWSALHGSVSHSLHIGLSAAHREPLLPFGDKLHRVSPFLLVSVETLLMGLPSLVPACANDTDEALNF